MARNESWTTEPTIFGGGSERSRYINSGLSPRVNGVIQFRQNDLADSMSRLDISRLFRYGHHPLYPYAYTGGLSIAFANTVLTTKLPRDWSFPSDVRESVDSKLRSKIGGVVVNVADLLRTRAEAGRMVINTVNRLTKAYRALRKGKPRRAAAYLGVTLGGRNLKGSTPPELWLELQYGWKPLLGDVYTLLNNPFQTVSGIVRASYKTSRPFNPPVFKQFDADHSVSGSIDYRAFARVRITLTDSFMSACSQWGVTNPLLLAWEAVPFSFVVDWMYPVGDYIESLGKFQGIRTDEYSCLIRSQVTVTGNHDFSAYNSAEFGDRKTQVSTLSMATKTRVTNGFSLIQVPSFQNPFSTGHVANALSLLATAFGRNPRRQ